MSALPELNAFAFDLDGTLADSMPDLVDAVNAMREHFAMPPLDDAKICSYLGDGIASLVHRTLTNDQQKQASSEQWQAGYLFFIQYYRDNLAKKTSLYAGVKAGLQLLNQLRLPLAVITNKTERLAVPLLKSLGILNCFSLVLGGDSLDEKKPSAMPLLHACEVFGIKPNELCMVGDSSLDVQAAKKAGAYSIAVSYGYQNAEILGANLIIDDISQIYDLLGKNS